MKMETSFLIIPKLWAIPNSLLHESNPEKIIASIGLEDMIIIDTPDALMICPPGEIGTNP